MGTLTYPTKTVSGGGTASYVEGKRLPAAELQADFDAIATVVNGGLDNSNIDASAAIAISKLAQISGSDIDDYSATDAENATTADVGDTASRTLPTTFDGEIEGLRYRIDKAKGYAGTVKYADSSGPTSLQDVAWMEPPIRGGNLLVNSGLEGALSAADEAPYGWSKSGTVSITHADAVDSEGTHVRHVTYAATGTTSITQTMQGLKPDTKYLFGVSYVRTSGTLTLSTAGGLASGDYQDPQYTDSSTSTIQRVSLVVQSDSSGSDIIVGISSGGSFDVDVIDTWFYELGDGRPAEVPTGLTQTASVLSEVTNVPATVASATDWDSQWTDIPGLALSQFIPSHGYRLIYEVSVAWASVLNSQQYFFGFRLEQDNGSTSIVDGPYIEMDDDVSLGETNGASVIRMTHVVDNPTPGLTYTFTPQATAADSVSGAGSAPRLHPLVAVTAQGAASAGSNSAIQTVSRSRLRLERI